MLQLHASSLEATQAVAAALAALCRKGDVLVLAGEMGAGKTAFAQGFGRELGIDEPVTSPTFTLVRAYDAGRLPLFHADIYRLSTQHEVADLGLAELGDMGVVLVEWGEVAGNAFGDHLLIRLQHDDADESARRITISGHGRNWAARWAQIEQAVQGWTC
jgi:tRNA threonylcarbamoyladenosine biosynthesis protein TsaE